MTIAEDFRRMVKRRLGQVEAAAVAAQEDADTAFTNLGIHLSGTTSVHGGIVAATDPRLTDARTPTAHAASHADGGADEITVGIAQLAATGTPSAGTVLRGDGTWGTVGSGQIAVGGVQATNILGDAVTNVKLANMAQNTIKGRVSSGSGDPEDLTASQARTVLGLGGAAVLPVGTTAGTVAAGDDSRIPSSPPRPPIDVQTFSTPGADTWTRPTAPAGCAPYSIVEVLLLAGGGGGGAGRRGAAGTVRCGGGGGGSGGATRVLLPFSAMGATEAVTVGAAGTGSAGVTADDTNGGAGVAGGHSWFGTSRMAFAQQGGGGAGGTATAGIAGTLGLGNYGSGAQGGTASATGGVGGAGAGSSGGVFAWSGSGGAGAGITTANARNNGGAGGGTIQRNIAGGAAGASAGAAGSTGAAAAWLGGVELPGGSGGGGGASSVSGTDGGAGGNGGGYGSGGGGGGASVNGNASGAGGNGGPGYAIVITR